MPDLSTFTTLSKQLENEAVTLVAVSKTKPPEDILALYEQGQRIFGENRVQEMIEKHEQLPGDIEWHLIGHLQRNKVKYIVPWVALIHSCDSPRLFREIEKKSAQEGVVTDVLLQFKIAEEDTKYGLDWDTATDFLDSDAFQQSRHVSVRGVMGMATFTENEQQVRREFRKLKHIFDRLKANWFQDKADFQEISMGMSGDYLWAIEEGSTMIRIGSMLFGPRD